jgi:hypothetical protein
MNLNTRKRGQSTKICRLANGNVRIAGAGFYTRSEVVDCFDLISGKYAVEKLFQIKPLVRRALQAAVIEVETVYVDIGPHGLARKCNGGP